MTSLAASTKNKRRKQETECNAIGSVTERETTTMKDFDSIIQTDVNSLSARVDPETLNSDQSLDDINSVSLKMETDKWYYVAAGFYSTCDKSEQVLPEEIHQESNHSQYHCQTSDLNMLATNPADQCPPISSTESMLANMKADTLNVETILTHQLRPSDVSKEADDRLLLGRWFALPSKNEDVDAMQGSVDLAVRHVLLKSHLEQTGLMFEPGSVNQRCEISVFKGNSSVITASPLNAAGFVSDKRHCLDPHNGISSKLMDVKPVLSTSDTDALHGNGHRGDIYIPNQGVLPFSVSPSVPSVNSKPTNTGQDAYIPLSNLSPQSLQPQYYQQQQPQLVTTVMTPQCGARREAVFDQIQDAGDQILVEHKLKILNELQPDQFCSQEDFEHGKFIPSVPHSSTDWTPFIHMAFKTEANALSTSPVQVLPMSISPSITSRSVTAPSSKSTDARCKRDCGEKSIKKGIPTYKSIGLSSNVTNSMDQKVAIFTLNDPHVSMSLICSDSESNRLQDVCESQSNKMPLSMTSNMAEVAVSSEVVNSNLVEESGECSSDDFEEIFIEKNKRKSKSSHLTLLSPKRVRGQGSSRGVVIPNGASVKENAVTRTVPLALKPAKMKLNEKGDRVKKVKIMKKAKTPENDKTEYSLQERNLASCMNLEPRVNDHFLYCGECNKEFEGNCPVHGPYNYIQDKEVPEGDPLKADHSLPDCLEIKTSIIAGAGLGVFSKEGLESRIMFGPYGGDIIADNNKSGYCWQVKTLKEGKPSHFVDAQNKATSNWMRYVNCARKATDRNLEAFQYKGGIYYCTLKPVSPGEELLVWYGVEFARELGLIIDKNVCSYSSKNIGHLKIHMMIHTRERQYKCEVCGYLCKQSGHLKTHMRIHTGETPYRCEECDYACNRSDHLKIHMRTHTGERLYKCDLCGYACSQSSTLKQHMRIHTGERPYKCDECDYACKQSGLLKIHKTIHTGETSYRCEVCGYECKYSGQLKAHMVIHTGERQYKCGVCGYEFNFIAHLKRHMRIHTGERPYKCEECGYCCKRSGDLKKHMRIHTGE